jgi:hypothetical protein
VRAAPHSLLERRAGLAGHLGEERLALWRLASGDPRIAATAGERVANRSAAKPLRWSSGAIEILFTQPMRQAWQSW